MEFWSMGNLDAKHFGESFFAHVSSETLWQIRSDVLQIGWVFSILVPILHLTFVRSVIPAWALSPIKRDHEVAASHHLLQAIAGFLASVYLTPRVLTLLLSPLEERDTSIITVDALLTRSSSSRPCRLIVCMQGTAVVGLLFCVMYGVEIGGRLHTARTLTLVHHVAAFAYIGLCIWIPGDLVIASAAVMCWGMATEFPLFVGLLVYRLRPGHAVCAIRCLIGAVIWYGLTRICQTLALVAIFVLYRDPSDSFAVAAVACGLSILLSVVQAWTFVIYHALIKNLVVQAQPNSTKCELQSDSPISQQTNPIRLMTTNSEGASPANPTANPTENPTENPPIPFHDKDCPLSPVSCALDRSEARQDGGNILPHMSLPPSRLSGCEQQEIDVFTLASPVSRVLDREEKIQG